jgi:uncharacterized membrane protein YccC
MREPERDGWKRILIALMYVGGLLIAVAGTSQTGWLLLLMPLGIGIFLLGAYFRTKLWDWGY